MSLIKGYLILQNARFTIFTVSEVLGEKGKAAAEEGGEYLPQPKLDECSCDMAARQSGIGKTDLGQKK